MVDPRRAERHARAALTAGRCGWATSHAARLRTATQISRASTERTAMAQAVFLLRVKVPLVPFGKKPPRPLALVVR